MHDKTIPEPWLQFLKDIDNQIDTEVIFHCFGGVAIKLLFGLPRETSDVDVLAALVRDRYSELVSIAGKESALNKKHGVYLDLVSTIAVVPDNYDERLIKIDTRFLEKIRLYVMDPHDIVLAKLGRNSPKDIQDVIYLAKAANLDTKLLRQRYTEELLPYTIGPEVRETGKLEFWLEMIQEVQSS